MGNLQKWGGPLSISWMNNQLALQHKILSRMRSLGMIPVLPAFSGFIPYAITQLYKVVLLCLKLYVAFFNIIVVV